MPNFVAYSNSIPVAGVASPVVGSSETRDYLLLQNNGTVTIFIGFGVIPNIGGTNALWLNPGDVFIYENGFAPRNNIYAIATINCILSIIEGRFE